jgi:hypothetical protein
MKQKLNRRFISLLSFAILSLSSFALRPGGDIYEIYLNNQLLTKQYSTHPLGMKTLHLSKANAADRLVVFYLHCGTIGKARKLYLRNDAGQVMKEWKFTDASGKDEGMVIPVKEILQVEERANSALSLFYSSNLMPEGKSLTALDMPLKGTVLHTKEKSPKS